VIACPVSIDDSRPLAELDGQFDVVVGQRDRSIFDEVGGACEGPRATCELSWAYFPGFKEIRGHHDPGDLGGEKSHLIGLGDPGA